MPYGLFRASRSHNPTRYSDIVELTLHFYPHIGAGPKVIHPSSCKHDVDSDLLTLASSLLRYSISWGNCQENGKMRRR